MKSYGGGEGMSIRKSMHSGKWKSPRGRGLSTMFCRGAYCSVKFTPNDTAVELSFSK